MGQQLGTRFKHSSRIPRTAFLPPGAGINWEYWVDMGQSQSRFRYAYAHIYIYRYADVAMIEVPLFYALAALLPHLQELEMENSAEC